MFGNQPIVQSRQIQRISSVMFSPVLDCLGYSTGYGLLARATVHSICFHAFDPIAHRTFRNAKQSRDLAVRDLPAGQGLYRHQGLLVEFGHPCLRSNTPKSGLKTSTHPLVNLDVALTADYAVALQ